MLQGSLQAPQGTLIYHQCSLGSIGFLSDHKVLMMNHKALHSRNSPQYLRDLVSIYEPRRTLRSASDKWTLSVPKASRKYGSRSFQVYGAALWNPLPCDLRQPMATLTFKRKLKTHFFSALV